MEHRVPLGLLSGRLSLRTRALDCYDYGSMKKGTVPRADKGTGLLNLGVLSPYAESPLFQNPLILHRKETFLHPNHPLHAQFARLTQQEEAAGMLADAAHIGTPAPPSSPAWNSMG